jgi:hypothetical protein
MSLRKGKKKKAEDHRTAMENIKGRKTGRATCEGDGKNQPKKL